MKKKLLLMVLAGMLALSVTACGGSGDSTNSDSNKTTQESGTDNETSAKEEVTYQTILDEYSQKIKDATPGLVEEYNTESAEKAGDITALAELSNAKVEKLAEICNEGVQKMAELKLKNGDDDATYTDWAGKLQAVYTEQAKQITDAYMNSASFQ